LDDGAVRIFEPETALAKPVDAHGIFSHCDIFEWVHRNSSGYCADIAARRAVRMFFYTLETKAYTCFSKGKVNEFYE
jgi:hypothetical protein